jgi:hypothetical protein
VPKPLPTFALDDVRVASPCYARWDEMAGDDRVRFCGSCRKNVYDLSNMSRGEAEALVRGAEGRLCVRFYRRADGTLLTQNCPVGLAAARQRLAIIVTAVAAWLGLLTAFFGWRVWTLPRTSPRVPRQAPAPPVSMPPATMGEAVAPTPPSPDEAGQLMQGGLCVRPPAQR